MTFIYAQSLLESAVSCNALQAKYPRLHSRLVLVLWIRDHEIH